MEKKYLLLILAFLFITSYGQTDTTIYFSVLGKPVNNNANPYESFEIKKANNGFVVKHLLKVNDSWRSDQLMVQRMNDSLFTVCDSLGKCFNRYFYKSNNGYIIKNVKGKNIKYGFSKTIFPLIKEGLWVDRMDTAKISEEFYKDNCMLSNKIWNLDGTEYYSNVFVRTEKPLDYLDGGLDGVRTWVSKNVKYPKSALEQGLSGKVIIQFVVTSDGKIDGIRVLKGIDKMLDNEAIRALRNLPDKWIPAEINGKPVNAFAVIPINFKLNE